MSPERHVRTRLYFTSESHVHSLLSTLRYGSLCDVSVSVVFLFRIAEDIQVGSFNNQLNKLLIQ